MQKTDPEVEFGQFLLCDFEFVNKVPARFCELCLSDVCTNGCSRPIELLDRTLVNPGLIDEAMADPPDTASKLDGSVLERPIALGFEVYIWFFHPGTCLPTR